MPSAVASLLAECFLSVVEGDLPEECWILRAYRRDPEMLAPLSSAIEIVTRCGKRSSLVNKLRAAHPLDRPHDAQHDDRILDVLTEACAFAWAADIRKLGDPRFCFDEGAPDIWVDSGWWIEAKTKHPPQNESQLRSQMLRSGAVVTAHVCSAREGLYHALCADFQDAKEKFQRQRRGKLVVFFNIVDFGISQWAIRREQFEDVVKFIHCLAAQEPEIEAVTCYAYNWRQCVSSSGVIKDPPGGARCNPRK